MTIDNSRLQLDRDLCEQLQHTYPQHEELVAEMKAVNAKLVIYADHLKRMIRI